MRLLTFHKNPYKKYLKKWKYVEHHWLSFPQKCPLFSQTTNRKKTHKNAQKIKYYVYMTSWEFALSYKLHLVQNLHSARVPFIRFHLS